MSRGSVVVFAKAPRPGHVKTRMVPPLSPGQAAGLYEALLADALDETLRWARAFGLDPVLTVHPPEARDEVARGAPAGFRVLAQRGRDLGARMDWAAREAAASGSPRVLLRGSDSPALDADTARAALDALEGVDLALRPDRDGGYDLVALRHPAPGLFFHPMSTGTVLEDTLARAAARGLRAHVLPSGFDLDVAEDLRWLAEARPGLPPDLCPRTLAYLDAGDLWGLPAGPRAR